MTDPAPLLEGTCEWAEDSDGVWNGSCGCHFSFEVGGVFDNAFAFCPYCGLKLVEVRLEAEVAERDATTTNFPLPLTDTEKT